MSECTEFATRAPRGEHHDRSPQPHPPGPRRRGPRSRAGGGDGALDGCGRRSSRCGDPTRSSRLSDNTGCHGRSSRSRPGCSGGGRRSRSTAAAQQATKSRAPAMALATTQPPCLSGAGMGDVNRFTSLARQRHPEVFADARRDTVISASDWCWTSTAGISATPSSMFRAT